MNVIEIPERKLKLFLPQKWEELSPKQYVALAHWLYLLQLGELTPSDVKLFTVCLCLNIIKTHNPQRTEEAQMQIDYNLMKLSELVNFIFEYKEINNQLALGLKLGFSETLLPHFNYKISRYYGPAQALNNLRYIEFVLAHNHYIQFTETQSEEHLNQLVAILYQPRRKRKVENENVIATRAKQFAKLSIKIKYAVYIYFESVMQWLAHHPTYGIIFQKKSESQNSESNPLGLLAIAYSLAERHIFGTFDTTVETYMYNVLDVLAQDKRTEIEIEKKLK